MFIVWALVTPTVLMHNYSFLSYLSVVGLTFSAVLPFIGMGGGGLAYDVCALLHRQRGVNLFGQRLVLA